MLRIPRPASGMFAFLMLLGFTAPAQDAANTGCFRLTESAEHYFGEIAQSDTVEHTFVFRNDCADTVEIGSAGASCGCTSVLLSGRVVPPGGEALVMARFTPPRGSRDRVSKTVSLYLKGASEPHSVLRVSATVRRKIDIDPSYIQISGATVGMRRTLQSTIRNVSDRELLIETRGVSLTSYPTDHKKAGGKALPLEGGTVTPTALRLKPGESGVLTIGLIPAFEGQINGSVGLKVGDDESVIFFLVEVGAAEKAE
ncbi:MAG: DUF1573 domain-containing protein [Bacteroidetes bacterium]|nr:DUF1573 domain-containing protein [Bacteroidota bacterium]